LLLRLAMLQKGELLALIPSMFQYKKALKPFG
jgi:hypothetical protein